MSYIDAKTAEERRQLARDRWEGIKTSSISQVCEIENKLQLSLTKKLTARTRDLRPGFCIGQNRIRRFGWSEVEDIRSSHGCTLSSHVGFLLD